MSNPATGSASFPVLRVDAIATRSSVRFFSDLIRFYLVDGVGLDPKAPVATHLRLAVMEAVTNVVRHAYAGQEPGPLQLEIGRDGDFLVVVVGDRGERFNPFAENRCTLPKPEELREGGYGLGIIDKVMEEVHHEYAEGSGNRLILRKKLWG